jgi:hypothetical protein
MATTLELTCARARLPPVVRRWLAALPPGEAERALAPADLPAPDETMPFPSDWVGVLVLARLVAAGHAAHATADFRWRVARIAAVVAAAPARYLALGARPPGTRAKLEGALVEDVALRITGLLTEAEQYAPPPAGPRGPECRGA